MKKSIVCFLLIITLSALKVWSQNQISGKVVDKSSNQAVEFTTVCLLRVDSSLYKVDITEANGMYLFQNVAEGDYLLMASLIGYNRKYANIKVPTANSLNEILLEQNSTQLKEVVVNSHRPFVEQKIDRMVVNVGSSLITNGKSAFQVLKNLPGVMSSGNELTVLGKEATIYIDGKATQLSSDQLSNLLNNIQGDQIDKIELITNPSSKYDAGIGGAIINIRTKRPSGFGMNGNVSLSLGNNQTGMIYRPGINLNFRTPKINAFGNYNYGYGLYTSYITYLRKFQGISPVTYDEKSTLVSGGGSNTLRWGIDYFPNKKQTLGLLFTGGLYDADNNTNNKTTIRNSITNQIDSNLISPILIHSKTNYSMINLNHRILTDTVNGELTTDIDYVWINDNSNQQMFIDYFDKDSTYPLRSEDGQIQSLNQITHIWTFKTDYTRDLSKKCNLELGVKYSNSKRDNIMNISNKNSDIWVINTLQSNHFIYQEEIMAGYLNLKQSFKKLSLMAGIRGESTQQKGNSVTLFSIYNYKYFGWFPSAYAQYKIDENQSFTFSFTRKLTRPNFNMLNPFKFYTSPKTYQEGNPELTPSYKQSYQFQYKYKKLLISLMHNISNNIFIQEPYQNDLIKEIGYTFKNFGLSKNYGSNINFGFSPFEWLESNINASFYYVIRSSRLMGLDFHKEYTTGDISITNEFSISKTLIAEIIGSYNTSYYYGAMHIFPKGDLQFALQKMLWDNKANLTLVLSDPFIWQFHKADYQYGNIDEHTTSRPDSRVLKLTFKYNFGSTTIKKSRNHTIGASEEFGRTN